MGGTEMTVKEIRIKAKEMGLEVGSKTKKADMIRTIQNAEGNTPCFQTGIVASCNQANCCWRSDCM